MQDLGTVKPGSPVRILWPSYDGGTGASIVVSAYAVGDIKIFKDGGTTERASTSGYVVDDDFSAETGIHLAEFDLADNDAAGFFVAGSEYIVMVGPVTIDGQTVNFPLCRFTIGYPGAILDTGIASLTSATQFILDNGPAEADVLIGSPVILHDVASAVQFAFGVVSDYIVTTKEVFLEATPVGFTPVATDNVSFFMPSPDLVIAKAVWDRILTGAEHNVTDSAGRRLRLVQESQGYEEGAVWIDTVNGTTGTTDFEHGTVELPVKTLAEAITIAASVGLTRFHVIVGSTITFAEGHTSEVWVGDNWSLVLAGQDISNIYVSGANVSGIGTGSGDQTLINCHLGACTWPTGTHLDHCIFEGTQTLGAAGNYGFNDCAHGTTAGISTIDFGSGLNASVLHMHPYHGGLEIQNMGAGTGTYLLYINGDGLLTFNANRSATSTVNIAGNWDITDNAGGAITVNDDARFDVDNAWTQQMADSTVADGTIPTREQAMLFLARFLTEFGISGTVLTINKEDGTTAVATFTLDDGTNPTSLTRAS